MSALWNFGASLLIASPTSFRGFGVDPVVHWRFGVALSVLWDLGADLLVAGPAPLLGFGVDQIAFCSFGVGLKVTSVGPMFLRGYGV